MLSLFFPVDEEENHNDCNFTHPWNWGRLEKNIVSVNVWKPIQINQIESYGKESVLVSDDCGQK